MSNHQFVKITNGWPSIDIGAMRHLITIQKSGPTSPPTFDAGGMVADGYQTLTTAMAAMDFVRGLDVIAGGQTTSQSFLGVAMWYQPGIEGDLRVVNDNGSVYVVQSIDNVLELGVCLILNCIALGVNT